MKKLITIITVSLCFTISLIAETSDVTGLEIPAPVNTQRHKLSTEQTSNLRGLENWTGDGPWGGIIRSIATSSGDDSKVLTVCGFSMANNGGVWKSENGGQDWYDTGLDHKPFYGLAASPTRDSVFYAGGKNGFYQSTDYGDSWQMLSLSSTFVLKIGVKSNNDDVILIGLSSSGGVRRSIDGGENWQTVGINSGFLKGVATSAAAADKFVIAGSDFLSSAMMSSNSGEDWTAIGPAPQGADDTGYDVYMSDDNSDLILLLHDDGIYKTIDGGENWDLVNSNSGAGGAFVEHNGNIYVGIWGQGVFVSTDEGDNWNSLPDAGAEDFWQAAGSSSAGVLMGYWGGINRSSDGTNWEFSTQGISQGFTHALAYYEDRNELWAGGEGNGIFCSYDGGLSWERKCNGLSSLWIYDFAPKSHYDHSVNRMLAATGSGLYASDDYGDNWYLVDMAGSKLTDVAIHWNDENQFWEAEQMGTVKYTSDNGQSWTTATGLPFGLYPKLALGENSQGDLRVFLCFENGYGTSVYYSDDNGATFIEASGMTGITYHPMLSVRLPSLLGNQVIYCATGQGLYNSEDYGETWSQVSGTSGLYWSVLGTRGEKIFLGSGSGVQYSDDGGDSWSYINEGIAGMTVWRLVYGDNMNQVYAATRGEPVLEYHFYCDADESPQPANASVQNYPNPFNTNTSIRYSLRNPAKVKINLYNTKGQMIKTLLNESVAQGNHEISYKNSDLATGIYFYKLMIDGKTHAVNKMIKIE